MGAARAEFVERAAPTIMAALLIKEAALLIKEQPTVSYSPPPPPLSMRAVSWAERLADDLVERGYLT